MEPSALTRTYRHIFRVEMSRSNAIKDRMRIVKIQQQHSISFLLATCYLRLISVLRTIIIYLRSIRMVYEKHLRLCDQETRPTSLS